MHTVIYKLSLLSPPACKTVAQADVVFLVDESWRFGQSSFSRVKDFISAVVSSYEGSVVGAEGVRFGVTAFGDVPRSDADGSFKVSHLAKLILIGRFFKASDKNLPTGVSVGD